MKIKTVDRISRNDTIYSVCEKNGVFECPNCGNPIKYDEPNTFTVEPIPNVTCSNCRKEYAFIK